MAYMHRIIVETVNENKNATNAGCMCAISMHIPFAFGVCVCVFRTVHVFILSVNYTTRQPVTMRVSVPVCVLCSVFACVLCANKMMMMSLR